jgi:hypothetical protein
VTKPFVRLRPSLIAFLTLAGIFFGVALLAVEMGASPRASATDVVCPSCDDFDVCTIDTCDTTTGFCRHDPRNCDDGNPCTTDFCDSFDCRHVNMANGTPCDDGNSCATNDACIGSPTAVSQCTGTILAPGTTCNDGNGCTTGDTCGTDGRCSGSPLAAGEPCDDQNACTSGDACAPGPSGILTCLGAAISCDDSNACTVDSCDPATGTCHTAPVSCDDGNACTADSCDPAGGCVHTAVTGACDDGDMCTTDDSCMAGNCQGVSTVPAACDDNRSCTTDQCIFNSCVHFENNTVCDDGSPCTQDFCDSVLGFPPTGCYHINVTGPICGNNRCFDLRCLRGDCVARQPFGCDDRNDCTTDVCDPAVGCSHFPVSGSVTCGVGACQRTVACGGGTPQTCVPGTPGLEVCNGIDDDCDGQIDEGFGTTTCGLGVCQRTAQNCLDGAPQTCAPGNPSLEVTNGLDDDCDGLVDENRVQADCTLDPSTLNLGAQGSSFSMTCRMLDVRDPANPVEIPGDQVGPVYLHRAEIAGDSSHDRFLPDPSTLPCPDPVLGFLYERGIVESGRDNTHHGFTAKFTAPQDGSCSTLDGNRQDLAALLAAVPDLTQVFICVAGKVPFGDFEGCTLEIVRNHGLR